MKAYELIENNILYNQWANGAIIKWLKEQPDYLIYEQLNSDLPSLNKLLHHMMEAETYYLSILSGVKAEYFDELSTDQVFIKLLEADQQLIFWFQKQSIEIVDKVISLKRSPHIEKYNVGTIITHMVNHSTHHRGQIITARHQLGISKPPKTDYYWMFAERLLMND